MIIGRPRLATGVNEGANLVSVSAGSPGRSRSQGVSGTGGRGVLG